MTKTKQKKLWVPTSLTEMFLTKCETYAGRDALIYKKGHHYEALSYAELLEESLKLAFSLRELGLEKGDRVMLISENRPEWVITDLAILLIGAVNVPIHSVLSSEQIHEVLIEISPKIIFFSNGEIENKLLNLSEDITKVDFLISYEKIKSENFSKVKYFKDLIDEAKLGQEERSEIIKSSLTIRPGDTATIIYTSGSTGHLKGVMLSHENFIQNIIGILGNLWAFPEDRFFSVLPLSHVFERTSGYYIPIYCGASIGYSIDLTSLTTEIKERKPTIVLAVPRLFEKIYEKVIEKSKKNIIKKTIFNLAFKYHPKNKNDLLEKIFQKLVFSTIREAFGGEIRFFVSGGAKLPEKIGAFFERAGLVILEGYGLTETSPVVAVNELNDYKFGTVGRILNNVKIKIDDEEILVKGPTVTESYLREDDNAEAFTKEGWFRTGDLGYVDKEGKLIITGRRKDLIVLTTGKKIGPVPIEEALESSEFIEQACIIGEGRKHVAAIIVPNFEALFAKFNISGKEKLLESEEMKKYMTEEVEVLTKHFASIERIKKFIMLKEAFSIENGEMTPTLKLRRHIITARNEKEIEKLYS